LAFQEIFDNSIAATGVSASNTAVVERLEKSVDLLMVSQQDDRFVCLYSECDFRRCACPHATGNHDITGRTLILFRALPMSVKIGISIALEIPLASAVGKIPTVRPLALLPLYSPRP
jgi:hypothetical protein